MKHILQICIVMVLAGFCIIPAYAVSAQDYEKKIIQKQVKVLEKDGWISLGDPLPDQLTKLYYMQSLLDDLGNPIYLTGTSISEGCSLKEAMEESENIALASLSSLMESTVEATTVSDMSGIHQEIIRTGISKVSQLPEKTVVVFSAYKKNGNTFIVKSVLAVDTRTL